MSVLLLKPLAVVVLLGGLIFVHELGHFLVAKLMGVKVIRFSLGFGPRLFGFRRGETEYQIAALPLGGYVKMAGDDPSGEIAPEDRGRGFVEQAPWRRLLIALAGPAMNLLLPFALLTALFWSMNGKPTTAAVVGTVVPGSPAASAGLSPGDRILSVAVQGGAPQPVRDFLDLQEKISPHPGEALTVELEREGRILPGIPLRPQPDEQSTGLETVRKGVIGIMTIYTPARVAPVKPGAAGPVQPFDLVVAAAGKPVKHAADLAGALEAAGCQPILLEVLREQARRMPGVVLADYARAQLAGVPTCVDGAPSLRLVDPWVSASVAAVEPGSPAEKAGLRRGDVVTAVNGKPVHTARELETLVNAELREPAEGGGGCGAPRAGATRPGKLTLADGRTLEITPVIREVQDEMGVKVERTTLGLFTDRRALVDGQALSVGDVPLRRTFPEVMALGLDTTLLQIRTLVIGIAKILSGEIASDQIGGVIQIVQETGKAVEQGLAGFVFFMAFFSVNLGIMNLLPIPVLDGGHIAQSIVETVTRRPLSLRMREIANVIGIVLLVSLMLFAFKNDLVRLFGPDRPPPGVIAR